MRFLVIFMQKCRKVSQTKHDCVVYIVCRRIITNRYVLWFTDTVSCQSSAHPLKTFAPSSETRLTLERAYRCIVVRSCFCLITDGRLPLVAPYFEANSLRSVSDYQEDLCPWRMLLKSVWETESCSRPWGLSTRAAAPLQHYSPWKHTEDTKTKIIPASWNSAAAFIGG